MAMPRPPVGHLLRPCRLVPRLPVAMRNLGTTAHAAAQYFATCHPGLEEVVAEELRSPQVGALEVREGKAGVHFSGDVAVMYKSNLWLRSAIRVLHLVSEIELDGSRPAGESVYAAFRAAANWPDLLMPGQSFSVDARVWGNTNLTNSQLLSIRARDAICDAIRDARGTKPMPPPPGRVADMPLFATAFQDRLSIYRDSSGQSLHRRGYRQAMHRASLNEAAAAGCLSLAGWPQLADTGATLADPMAGSGTFLIEAALMATHTAPGLFRRWWPFAGWPDADKAAWQEAFADAEDARIPGTGQIWGGDIHGGALSLADRDAEAAGVRHLIRLYHGDCADWELPYTPQLVISNPPWGQRLMGREDRGERQPEGQEPEGRRRGGRKDLGGDVDVTEELITAWGSLGKFLKRQDGVQAFLLSGSTQATQHLRLKSDARIPVTVGGIDCRLLRYRIHSNAPAMPRSP